MGRQLTVRRGATRVVFGAGSSGNLAREIEALGAAKVLVVCTPGRAKDATAMADRLGARSAGVFAEARQHVPVDTVNKARKALDEAGADAVLALGGGSAIGLAKALALEVDLRIIAVPTTYAGSETTSIYGITDGGTKRTGRDERVRPVLVLYDPDRLASLPHDVAMASLWNAMAHAVEATWVNEDDRAARAIAEDALRLIGSSLGRLAAAPDDAAAREDALEGAYLAGSAFADTGSGLHHRICHVLGGMFDLPHAPTHAAMLPHVARFEREAAPKAFGTLSRALGVIDPVAELDRLARLTGVPTSLGELGMPRDGIAAVVDALLAGPPLGPRALEREALTAMLEEAYDAPPSLDGAPDSLRAPETIATQNGFGGVHQSEVLEGAIPWRQNAPRLAPYGLFPELVSGTPFTVRNAQNARVWFYRVRPSFAHHEAVELAPGAFLSPLAGVTPNRTRWRPLPIPEAPSRVDFLDGLVTLGGTGDETSGPGYRVHMYAANADMRDRSFASADGDLLLVPQTGTLECRTECGWLRVPVGAVAIIPRGIKLAIGLGEEGTGRGWMLEVFGRSLRLPERGLIGSNGLADARHFLAPTASYEDRLPPGGFRIVTKLGGKLFAAMQAHSPFDVVGWHGSHVPYVYDLSLFAPMGSVGVDHPDPSILTVLNAPLDDYGRAIVDFVIFPGRWEVHEGFRPPFMHRNAASEINGVVYTSEPEHGYNPGVTFVSPLLTPHGVSADSYDEQFDMSEEEADAPTRLPEDSLWMMFESALPFQVTEWARRTPLVDRGFAALFDNVRPRFNPTKR